MLSKFIINDAYQVFDKIPQLGKKKNVYNALNIS